MECPLLGELRTDMWRDPYHRRVSGTLLFNQLLQKPKVALLVAKFMLKTGLLSVSSGGSCGNWLDARKI
jgi:hypothetical protein